MRFQVVFILLVITLQFTLNSYAERAEAEVVSISASGRSIKFNVGSDSGINLKEAILIRNGDQRVAAARVIQVANEECTVYVVDNFIGKSFQPGEKFNILFGIPNGEPATDNTLSGHQAEENPKTEKFFEPDGTEYNAASHELDDTKYTPETIIKPRIPERKLFNTHNLTIGVAAFRNADLSQTLASPPNPNATALYQGYTIRYAYNFKTHYWLGEKRPAIFAAEMGLGTYTFPHTFPNGSTAQITVMPLILELKYIFEINKFFRAYPYLGFMNNLVGGTSNSATNLGPLRGGRIMGGLGTMLVISENVDLRLDVGIYDSVFGLVAKF